MLQHHSSYVDLLGLTDNQEATSEIVTDTWNTSKQCTKYSIRTKE